MKYNVLKGKKISDFDDLLSICIGKSLSNQLLFSKMFVFKSKWSLDFDRGLIYFHDINKSFSMEIIGTELLDTSTWLWAWADSSIPTNLSKKSKKLRDIGIKYDIDVLKKDGFILNGNMSGKNISLIATILDEENVVYYRGAFPGGYIYMYIGGLSEKVFEQLSAVESLILFNQVSHKYNINDRLMVQSFFELNDNVLGVKKDNIIGIYNMKSQLIVKFLNNKIVDMKIKKRIN